MTRPKGTADKNISNVVKDLDKNPVNSHHAQQLQQDTNDRRHQAALNHDEPTDLEHQRS
jgi:predicted DNA binding CopG/RHH family protein